MKRTPVVAVVCTALTGGFGLGNISLGRAAATPPTAVTAEGGSGGERIAVRFAGRLQNESTDPGRLVFTGDMLSLGTGDKLGTMTHDVAVPCSLRDPSSGCAGDVVNTFRFTDGSTIVNRAQESFAPDPRAPGFFLVGIHPTADSIEGTGRFTGRTGRAHMSARHDGSALPGFATFDDFWLIELGGR